MKPISVTMQAFGSYTGRTTVDFSALGDSPIFLITGSTGGGKTTILDAMCFALYCRATGGRRSWGSMRSTAAPDNLPTVVDFCFTLGKESYRFCRSQDIHYVRGSGRREVREEHACYHMENGEWQLLNNRSETSVREYAQQLLGLTCEQFSQVIVLPQGDFLKLLRANSVNKAEILQTLFATGIWSDVSKAVKLKADNLEKKAGELRAAKQSVLEREECADDGELNRKLEQTKAELAKAQADFAVIREQLQKENLALSTAQEISRKLEELQKLKKRMSELEQSAEQMQKNRSVLRQGRQIQQIYPYFKAAQDAKQEMHAKFLTKQASEQKEQQASAALLTAQTEAKNIAPFREKATALTQSITKLETARGSAVRLKELQKQYQQKTAEIDKQIKLEETALLQLNTAAKNVENGNIYIKNAQNDIQKLPEQLAQVQRLQADYDALCALERLQKEFAETQKEYAQADQKQQEHAVKQEAMRTRLEQEEQAMREDIAGTLSAALTEGTPCPVCGSTSHPSPACHKSAGFDAKQLELLRKSVAEEDKVLQKLAVMAASCKAKLDQRSAELSAQQIVCETITQSSGELKTQLETAKNTADKTKKAGEQLNSALARLEQRKAEQTEVQNTLEGCKAERARLEREAEGLRAGAAEIEKSLGNFNSIEGIEAELKKQTEQAEQFTRQAAQLEKNLTNAQSDVAAAGAAAKAALQAYQEAIRNEETASRQFAKEAETANLPEQLDFAALRRSTEELAQLEQTINTYDRDSQAVKQQLEAVKQSLKDISMPDMDALHERQAEAQKQNDLMSQQIGSLQQRTDSSEKSLQQLEALTRTGSKTEQEYAHASRLASLLSGKNPSKIPLQQFVLGIMLDDILASANQFFSTLSRGRYSLNRINGSVGGNSLSGLDLEVLDAFSGGTRSIETLSGGEQFLASLSLAFGLSDVVQSYSGSVHLDAIFIDEGFGSLDQETLDTAMKALMQIQRMGRTIGIISHVSELKDRIAAHIEVYKAPDGGSAVRLKTE